MSPMECNWTEITDFESVLSCLSGVQFIGQNPIIILGPISSLLVPTESIIELSRLWWRLWRRWSWECPRLRLKLSLV
jgi:hypothetical protein